jgi:hypothetical protein
VRQRIQEGGRSYHCNTHRTRGNAACTAKQPLPLKEIHDTAVRSFTHDILTPALLDTVVGNLIEEATRPEAPGAREHVVSCGCQ